MNWPADDHPININQLEGCLIIGCINCVARMMIGLQQSLDVGGNFAREARAMHVGDVPEKPIHGQAGPEEARALIEDGVPILPLPGISGDKSN